MLGTLTWIYFADRGQLYLWGRGWAPAKGWGSGGGAVSPTRADGCSASAGSSLGCFHWSQGVKLRASVRLLLEWLRGAGFEQLAQQFFAKLASVANLLAMPGSQLVQVRNARPGAHGIGMGTGRRDPARHLGDPCSDTSLLQPVPSCAFLGWWVCG